MKKTFLLLSFFALILRGSTTAQNPYASLGKVAPVLTLSEGKYQEFMTNDTIVQIGSVLFNTLTNEVVSFLEEDSLRLMEADMMTRFLSVDPIARQYPELTPYQFASNRPIDGIDLDGLEWKKYVEENDGKTIITFEVAVQVYDKRQKENNPSVAALMGAAQKKYEANTMTDGDITYKVSLVYTMGEDKNYYEYPGKDTDLKEGYLYRLLDGFGRGVYHGNPKNPTGAAYIETYVAPIVIESGTIWDYQVKTVAHEPLHAFFEHTYVNSNKNPLYSAFGYALDGYMNGPIDEKVKSYTKAIVQNVMTTPEMLNTVNEAGEVSLGMKSISFKRYLKALETLTATNSKGQFPANPDGTLIDLTQFRRMSETLPTSTPQTKENERKN